MSPRVNDVEWEMQGESENGSVEGNSLRWKNQVGASNYRYGYTAPGCGILCHVHSTLEV